MRLTIARLITVMAVVLLGVPLGAEAQTEKVYRVGILQAGALSAHTHLFEAFRKDCVSLVT